MKKFLAVTTMVLFTASLAVAPAWAGRKHSKVKGHVVKVEQQVKAANGGESDRLTIRTRSGEQLNLDLGKGGACEGCYQVGDQVRARVKASEGSGGGQGVQSMQVRRDGRMFGYTNDNGMMVQSSNQGHAGSGNGDRVRDRTHEPGSAGCTGTGSGQRGGAGGQSGGGGGGRRGGN